MKGQAALPVRATKHASASFRTAFLAKEAIPRLLECWRSPRSAPPPATGNANAHRGGRPLDSPHAVQPLRLVRLDCCPFEATDFVSGRLLCRGWKTISDTPTGKAQRGRGSTPLALATSTLA